MMVVFGVVVGQWQMIVVWVLMLGLLVRVIFQLNWLYRWCMIDRFSFVFCGWVGLVWQNGLKVWVRVLADMLMLVLCIIIWFCLMFILMLFLLVQLQVLCSRLLIIICSICGGVCRCIGFLLCMWIFMGWLVSSLCVLLIL